MKRKLIFGLITILAIGLAVIGCSNSSTDSGGGPVGFAGLNPWTPEPITEPAAGYKSFLKGAPAKIDDGSGTMVNNPARDGLLGYTAFYVSAGEEGFIEEGDNEGEYNVTVKTNPGGVSLISFQDDDFQYKTGFYLSLDLPTPSDHKPIGMVALPSKGMQDTGAIWSSGAPQYVNLDTTEKPIKDDVYLAGRVDFAWQNENNPWPLRTICLRIIWHADEEAGAEYTFKVRKILIPENDDLTLPAYPVEKYPYDPISVPGTGWKDFPAASITGASVVTTTGGSGTITVTPVADGYSITVPTDPGNHTDITFPAASGSAFIDGYYLSLALPENATAALRPYRVYAYPNSYWDGAVDLYPDPGYYVGGNVDMKWANSETAPNTSVLDTITLNFYWHDDEPVGGEYTFILKTLKITDGNIQDPWDNFVNFYTPNSVLSGTIAPNYDSSFNQYVVNLTNTAGKYFTGGYYVSLTLSDANTVMPQQVLITAFFGDNWDDIDGDYVTQKIIYNPSKDIVAYWDGKTWGGDPHPTKMKRIECVFRWDTSTSDGTENGKTLAFTVNAAKVGALVDAP